MSVAGDGLTEPNNYFCQWQKCKRIPLSPPKNPPLVGELFLDCCGVSEFHAQFEKRRASARRFSFFTCRKNEKSIY
jgi:hypothetical protein